MTTHCVIPDTQVKPGVDLTHLSWCGQYLAEKRPDVIVMIGDWADMPSLSSYDIGKRSFEGRTYKADVEASIEGMELLMAPIRAEQKRRVDGKKKQWNPRLVLTLGNHENRIDRAIENDRKLEGLISVDDLKYKEFGWEVIPFLETITIDGICYAHYFTSGVMGRPVASASALVRSKHMSCTQGHVQQASLDMTQRTGEGRPLFGLFAGVFYSHDESYLNPQTNRQHVGFWMKYEVDNGSYCPCPITLSFLRKRYG